MDRIAPGTKADPQQLNKLLVDMQDRIKSLEDTVYPKLAEMARQAEMATVQAWCPPVFWNKATINPLRDRNNYVSGTAEQDCRFAQVIQPITSWSTREGGVIKVSQPVASGGPKVWQSVGDQQPPYGIVYDAPEGTNPGDMFDAYVRVTLPSTRTCNVLVFDPYPAFLYNLVSAKLLTSAGEVNLSLADMDTDHTGPQRWFFANTECYGAEIKLNVFKALASSKLVVGCMDMELAKVTTQPSASFTINVADTTIDTWTVSGRGSISSSLGGTGDIIITITTPPDSPTSIVQGITWTTV